MAKIQCFRFGRADLHFPGQDRVEKGQFGILVFKNARKEFTLICQPIWAIHRQVQSRTSVRRHLVKAYERNQPVSPRVLSLVEKKPPLIFFLNWPSLKKVPKKPCQTYISELLWHLMSEFYALVIRWLFASRNGIHAIFGMSRFQKFNIVCLLLPASIFSSKSLSIFNFVCPLWTWSVIRIWGVQMYISPFFGLKAQILS